MNKNFRPWYTHFDSDTCQPISRHQGLSHEPLMSDDWGMEITVYLRCVIQQSCSGATIEYLRSERSIHSGAKIVGVGVRYPASLRDRFELALDALGRYWPIHEAGEQPVYLTMLQWGGQLCYVQIYDQGEDPTAMSWGSLDDLGL